MIVSSQLSYARSELEGRTLRIRILACLLSIVSVHLVAQTTEVSASFMAEKTTDQTIHFPAPVSCGLIAVPTCAEFGQRLSDSVRFAFLFTYAHRIVRTGPADLYLEAPFFVIPAHDMRDDAIASIPLGGPVPVTTNVFITPSLKAKFLSANSVSPFVSVGGGWAHYGGNGLNSVGTGVTTTAFNTWALQFGGGVDFRLPVSSLAVRTEFRDVLTRSRFGDIGDQRPHNLFMGVGLVYRQ